MHPVTSSLKITIDKGRGINNSYRDIGKDISESDREERLATKKYAVTKIGSGRRSSVA